MSNFLLLFFALPVAISILSAIFETLIHSPIKIAGITFSILLIVTFAVADETFLIFTILYTLLAYIVAWITKQWCQTQKNSDNADSATGVRDAAIEELIQRSTLNNNALTAPDSEYTRRFRRR